MNTLHTTVGKLPARSICRPLEPASPRIILPGLAGCLLNHSVLGALMALALLRVPAPLGGGGATTECLLVWCYVPLVSPWRRHRQIRIAPLLFDPCKSRENAAKSWALCNGLRMSTDSEFIISLAPFSVWKCGPRSWNCQPLTLHHPILNSNLINIAKHQFERSNYGEVRLFLWRR